jgi:apolipoprotein D and lipocalin family protein
MGDWYVIAHIPTPFEKDATNAVESFHWNQTEERIDIEYHHNEGSSDGPLKHYPQKAWITDRQNNADWKVEFFWPMKFNYQVLEVASDYTWALIGTSSKNYVWILARKPHLDDETYLELLKKLEGWGYDLATLRKIPQIWDQVS